MTVRVSPVNRWAVLVRVDGEVDLGSARTLEARLGQALETPDLLAVVVDLSGVGFLAAAGLSTLVRVAERAESMAVRLHLVAEHRAVLRPLEVTGLLPRFRVHADAADALSRYESASSR
ncbi:STAS domain-containing protein [Actinokineospora sp. G85]|uniref:STAS domain-containing protein n=1 Tax=Actinokineospora sp. G85 TaxID=3406626 RepID=UPI003C713492